MCKFNVKLNQFNDIRDYLKRSIKPWKDQVIQQHKGRCTITGQHRNVHVHHLSKSFEEIFQETFKTTGIPNRHYTYKYSETELTLLRNACLALHMNVKGVVIAARFHKEYHQTYTEISEETFAEYKRVKKKQHGRRTNVA